MNKKILVIEDDEGIAEVVKIILEGEGYDVIVDQTGESVFRGEIKDDFSLIMVDYLLPNTNGALVVTAIKASDKLKNVPIIMTSANTKKELSEIAEASGVSKFLPKPFEVDELLLMIKETIA